MYWMQYRCYEYILANFLIINSWWCLISRRKMYLYGKFRVAPTAVARCPPDVHFASNFALTFTINTHRSRQFTTGWSIPPFVIYWHIVFFFLFNSIMYCISFIYRTYFKIRQSPSGQFTTIPTQKKSLVYEFLFLSPTPANGVTLLLSFLFVIQVFIYFFYFLPTVPVFFFHLKGSWDSPATINTSYTYYKASPSKFTSHIFHDYSYTFFSK